MKGSETYLQRKINTFFVYLDTISMLYFIPKGSFNLSVFLMIAFLHKDTVAMAKLKVAVRGKNNMNVRDLKHLTKFVHTGR